MYLWIGVRVRVSFLLPMTLGLLDVFFKQL